MDTNQDKGKELLGVTLTNTEAHGVICAALFYDYNRTEHGVGDDILMDLCYDDRGKALRRAIIRLANRKIAGSCMDMVEIPLSDDNPNRYAMDDDLFGGPRTAEDCWDGDETDKIQY